MPVIQASTYNKPKILFNRHFETIIPGLLRRVKNTPVYERERITTPDYDFLDLDWIKNDTKRVVIISHGLEGDSQRPYIKGMAKAFSNEQWDVLAWNFRGCGGEKNKRKIFYHSGATYDLQSVVSHAVNEKYEEIILIGFSLGGNLTLKYLGESESNNIEQIKGAVTFSVPLDLAGCSNEIDLPHNFLYSKRFLKSLKNKVNDKKEDLGELYDEKKVDALNSIYDFDDQITAPVHGFKDAHHYYQSCSSRNFISSIKIKTLVVNAQNDPFLSASCLDKSLFENLNTVFFETPKQGGHVGFSSYNKAGLYWSEKRALEFVNEELENHD